MISWTSCSGSRLGCLCAVVLAFCGACAHARRTSPSGAELRIAVFPPEDLSGGAAPLADLRDRVLVAAARTGAEVVSGPAVDDFLARHRMRFTGGIDGEGARAAREEIGVNAVLLTTVVTWAPTHPPSVALAMRLVSTEDEPTILWMAGASGTGLDSVGFLGLGGVDDPLALSGAVLRRLTASLERWAAGRSWTSAEGCSREGRFEPETSYRASGPSIPSGARVAVLPFENRTNRRGAGQAIALEFLRALVATERFRPLDPGVVRAEMLRFRMVMNEGVTFDAADMLLGSLQTDVVVSGTVEEFLEVSGAPSSVGFSAIFLDAKTHRIIARLRSHHRGDDGVRLFGTGIVRSAPGLACRMVESTLPELHLDVAKR